MNQPSAGTAASVYKDRRAGLIGFGILVILIGCADALMIPVMLLGQAISAKNMGIAAPPFRTLIPGLVTYGALAVAFVWLGIGSILARRWARALLLVVSWGWLVIGICTVGSFAMFFPAVLSAPTPAGHQMPEAFRTIMLVTFLGVFSVIFVILPALLICFYQSRHVKATCEARDPVRRWTDACPLPVLALSLLLGFAAASLATMPFAYNFLPVFGRVVTGAPATVLIVLMTGVLAWAAWACYRLKPAGWWLAVIGIVLAWVSGLVTFAQVDMAEIWRQMGYPEEQVTQLQKFDVLKGRGMVWLMVLCVAPLIGYVLYVKRYFRQRA